MRLFDPESLGPFIPSGYYDIGRVAAQMLVAWRKHNIDRLKTLVWSEENPSDKAKHQDELNRYSDYYFNHRKELLVRLIKDLRVMLYSNQIAGYCCSSDGFIYEVDYYFWATSEGAVALADGVLDSAPAHTRSDEYDEYASPQSVTVSGSLLFHFDAFHSVMKEYFDGPFGTVEPPPWKDIKAVAARAASPPTASREPALGNKLSSFIEFMKDGSAALGMIEGRRQDGVRINKKVVEKWLTQNWRDELGPLRNEKVVHMATFMRHPEDGKGGVIGGGDGWGLPRPPQPAEPSDSESSGCEKEAIAITYQSSEVK